LWPVVLALGVGFTFLNLIELVFLDLDGGWPQIVGVVIGLALVAVGIARLQGWERVAR
jgi:hypothetical protein